MKCFKLSSRFLALVISPLLIMSCGGGGGGGSADSATEPAFGELSVTPPTAEVGGVFFVSIKISDVAANLAVKLRVPQSLSYEIESSRLIIGNQSYDVGPAVNVAVENDSSSSSSSSSASSTSGTPTPTPAPEVPKRILVYYIPASFFVGQSGGDLRLSFRGTDLVNSGRVEVDIDVDNPDIANSSEFSATSPLFESEDAISIRVKN